MAGRASSNLHSALEVAGLRPKRTPLRRVALSSVILVALVAFPVGCTSQDADVKRSRDLLIPPGEPVAFAPSAPLSLETAIHLTVERNEQLRIEGERYVQALAAVQRATASLLPTLDLVGAFNFHEGNASVGGGNSTAPQTSFDFGPAAQYTLMTGMSDFANVEALELTAEGRRWLALDLRESLLLESARAYYTTQGAEQLVDVLESSLRVQAERLRDVKARQTVGMARPLDVSQVEAQYSRTQAALLDAKRIARNARTALAFATNADIAESELTDGLELPAEPPALEPTLAQAAATRQDLKAQEERVRAARREVDAAIGQYAPTVRVNLDYFVVRETPPSERDFAGLLEVSIPVFSAGRIEADVRLAWSAFRESLLNLSLARRQVRSDVTRAIEDVRADAERVREFERLVGVAGEALRQAEGAYGAGLGTNLERMVAQDQLLAAQLALATELAQQKVAYLALLRAVGSLSDGTLHLPPTPPPPERGPLPTSPFITLPEVVPAQAALPASAGSRS